MTLDKDMITEPRMWQLVMEPTAGALSVMAFSPIEHHCLIASDLPYPPEADSGRAFKDAVYDNPLLLSDFQRITVLLPTRHFLLLPDIMTDRGASMALFRKAFPAADDGRPSEILSQELPGLRARMLLEIDSDMLGFLRRTFNNPHITHPLVPLALYFKGKHPNRSSGKMIANLRRERVDIVILGDASPLVMNTFDIRDPMDAVYYIMACRQACSLRPTDEIILAGDSSCRRAVTPHLRRFIRYVMPAIFPSMMTRSGRASLSVPFEMIVSPIAFPSVK